MHKCLQVLTSSVEKVLNTFKLNVITGQRAFDHDSCKNIKCWITMPSAATSQGLRRSVNWARRPHEKVGYCQ